MSFTALMLALTLVGTISFVGPQRVAAQEECDVNTDPLCAEDDDINTVNEVRLDLGMNPGQGDCVSLEQMRLDVSEDFEHLSGCLFNKVTLGSPFVFVCADGYYCTADNGSTNYALVGSGQKVRAEAASVYDTDAFGDACDYLAHETFYALEHDIEIVTFGDGFEDCTIEDESGEVDLDVTT